MESPQNADSASARESPADTCVSPTASDADSTNDRAVCAYGLPTPCATCISLGLSDSVTTGSNLVNGTNRKRVEYVEAS